MIRPEFTKMTKPLIHGRASHVLGEKLPQIGTQALIHNRGATGQLRMDLTTWSA